MNIQITLFDTKFTILGDTPLEIIRTCLDLPSNFPHEIGHYMAAKYYNATVHSVAFAPWGGNTLFEHLPPYHDHVFIRAIPKTVLETYGSSFPFIRTFLEKTNKHKHELGMITLAGPLSSMLFHTANLVQMAYVSCKAEKISRTERYPNSLSSQILNSTRFLTHIYCIIDELEYVFNSSYLSNNGDFGILRTNHFNLYKIGWTALGSLALVALFSSAYIVLNYKKTAERNFERLYIRREPPNS